MMRISTAIVLACLLCSEAGGDSWARWGDRRVIDADGRHYVVLKRIPESREISFVFAMAAKGSPSVEAATVDPSESRMARLEGREARQVDLDLRKGDAVLARGRLAHAPLRVLVSAKGLGFVALERHGGIGYGDCVVLVPRDGKAIRKLRLPDLFDTKTIASFPRSTSSINWFRGGWIDEDTGAVVVVGIGRLLRVVRFDSEDVLPGGPEVVLGGLRQLESRGLGLALELSVERNLAGPTARLLEILADEALTLKMRLRAALLLARSGEPRGVAFFAITARASGEEAKRQSPSDRIFVLDHLAEVMGEKALPILLDLIVRDGDEGYGTAGGIARFGERAIPDLERLLLGGLPHVRARAAGALGEIGSRRVMPLLLRAVRDEDEHVANTALNSAIEISGAEVAVELAALLEEGSTQDSRIAGYFEQVSCASAIPALVTALGRQPKGSYERARVLKSLKRRSGQKIGDDPEAWKAWLEQSGH
jgi:HEAT repeats